MSPHRKNKKKSVTSSAPSARLLYGLYKNLAREFMIDLPACPSLDDLTDEKPEPASMEEATAWFLDADKQIPVHQLRQFLQTSKLASPEGLRAALDHHLHKADRGSADRDKTDFLLVQFLSACSASKMQDADASFDFVARTLEPILGTVETTPPESLRQLEEIVAGAGTCRSLKELFASTFLDQGRSLKISSGDSYFEPSSLVAFTRFNFLMRRVFFRLVHQDLNAILEGLRELEQRGVQTLDCRSAEFSAEEPVSRLRMICQSWKVMFQAEYSSGQPLRLLVELREVVDSQLAGEVTQPAEETASPLRARAAAASGDSSGSTDSASSASTSSADETK
jgi:hypothetical protein